MKQLLYILIAASLGCHNPSTAKKEDPTPSSTIQSSAAAPVGNDTDAHGCKKSAGYTWSIVKNECVRIWEAGTQYKNYGENKDSTAAAYLIYAADNRKVELFLPGSDSSIILTMNTAIAGNGATTIVFANNKAKTDIQFIPAKDIYLIRIMNKPLYYYSPEGH